MKLKKSMYHCPYCGIKLEEKIIKLSTCETTGLLVVDINGTCGGCKRLIALNLRDIGTVSIKRPAVKPLKNRLIYLIGKHGFDIVLDATRDLEEATNVDITENAALFYIENPNGELLFINEVLEMSESWDIVEELENILD